MTSVEKLIVVYIVYAMVRDLVAAVLVARAWLCLRRYGP